MNQLKKLLPVIFIVLLSFWSIKTLLAPGFFPIHDDTQVARVFEMHKGLSDGMFPVRWIADLGYGYGYPIFNFYAPLPYYLGALFMFLGLNALWATKMMIVFGMLFAGVSMYFLGKEFWGTIGGIVSGLLYVYAPYHALNAYVRGAISEFWAYAFIPLVFFSTYKVFHLINSYINLDPKRKKQNIEERIMIKRSLWRYTTLTSVSFACVILSHNLTAMMVTPFIFVFSMFLYIKLRTFKNIYKPYFVLLGFMIGILLSAFYWLPVPFEMKYTDVLSVVGGGSDYNDHFACLLQFWNSPWGFAGSGPGCVDGFSLKIGKLHLLLGSISAAALFAMKREKKYKFQIIVLFLIFLVVSVFLSIKESRIIWDAIPHMAFFQFPWRFLILISFFISFLGGGFFWWIDNASFTKKLPKYTSLLICGVVSILIVVVNAEVFVPQKILSVRAGDYTNKQTLNWKISRISDEYMPNAFFKPLRPVDVPRRRIEAGKNVQIKSITEKTQEINASVNVEGNATLNVNLAYFPGWHIYLNGKQVWFRYSGQGLLVDVPKGHHNVSIRFTQTPIEKLGNAISVAGVLLLLIGIIRVTKNKNYG